MSFGSVSHDYFLTCTMQNGLTQIVNCPTRGHNCIDLILASDPGLVYEMLVCEPFSSSCDHASIDFQIICPNSAPSSGSCSYFYDFRHADYSAIIQHVSDIDWLLLFNTNC